MCFFGMSQSEDRSRGVLVTSQLPANGPDGKRLKSGRTVSSCGYCNFTSREPYPGSPSSGYFSSPGCRIIDQEEESSGQLSSEERYSNQSVEGHLSSVRRDDQTLCDGDGTESSMYKGQQQVSYSTDVGDDIKSHPCGSTSYQSVHAVLHELSEEVCTCACASTMTDPISPVHGWGCRQHCTRPSPPGSSAQAKRPMRRAGSYYYDKFYPKQSHVKQYKFQHHEDSAEYIKQYLRDHTCQHTGRTALLGAEPHPVLGRDVPDPYIDKLRNCRDLFERLLFLSSWPTDGAYADGKVEAGPARRRPSSAMLSQNVSRDLSDPDSPTRSWDHGDRINLAPVRREPCLSISGTSVDTSGEKTSEPNSDEPQSVELPDVILPATMSPGTLKGGRAPKKRGSPRSPLTDSRPKDIAKFTGLLKPTRFPGVVQHSNVEEDRRTKDKTLQGSLYRQYMAYKKRILGTSGQLKMASRDRDSQNVLQRISTQPNIGVCEVFGSSANSPDGPEHSRLKRSKTFTFRPLGTPNNIGVIKGFSCAQ